MPIRNLRLSRDLENALAAFIFSAALALGLAFSAAV